VRPGLDQPPPLCGDGDRDNDMSGARPGVSGTASSCCPKRPEVVPEVVPYVSSVGELLGSVKLGDIGAREERRRWWEEVAAEDEVATMGNCQKIGRGDFVGLQSW
jgi:hypothetical protein